VGDAPETVPKQAAGIACRAATSPKLKSAGSAMDKVLGEKQENEDLVGMGKWTGEAQQVLKESCAGAIVSEGYSHFHK